MGALCDSGEFGEVVEKRSDFPLEVKALTQLID